MLLTKQLSFLLASALGCVMFNPLLSGQQTAEAMSTPPLTPALTPPLTDDALRARYMGKLIFLRSSYLGDDLHFDVDGKVEGSPSAGSFTLSAFEVKKVKLSKHKLDLEADRYGLHFFGTLLYEDDSKPFDRVRISRKPVHISIERELIVIPKVKKGKKNEPSPRDAAPVAISPAHSAMLMNKALDNVFATDIDPKMVSQLPDYWQEYFTSKSQHRPYMPTDAGIKTVSEGITPPKVLSSIDPSSNQYAQKFGIAGMELLRTVVDANGVPQPMAIDRPIGFGLDEKAVEAVKNSRFRPATVNGQPVPVVIDVIVTFRIYSNRTRPGSVRKGRKEGALGASFADSDAILTPRASGFST